MTVGEVLDRSFRLIRQEAGTLLPAVALFIVPAQVLGLVARLTTGDSESLIFSGSGVFGLTSLNTDSLPWLIAGACAGLIEVMGTAFAGALACQVMIASHSGEVVSTGSILRTMGRKSWSLVASWFAVHLLEASGFIVMALILWSSSGGDSDGLEVLAAMLVGGLPAMVILAVVMTLSVAVVPCIMVEDLGPIAAVRRSWRLMRRRFFPVLGITFLAGTVSGVVGQAFGALPFGLGIVIGGDGGSIIITVASGLVAVITATFTGFVASMLYLDTRIRTEGLDLDIIADRLLDEGAP